MSKRPRPLELLAPARDLATGLAAIAAGADAVYIGGPSHGARAAAGNSVDDLRRLCAEAHRFRARVYVTLNTLVYEDEIEQVRSLVGELYAAGVDALIVQDMSLLRMDIPPIALHASTQCDTRTPEKAAFLEAAGFSQIVLPREFTLDEIRRVADSTTVPLEAFIHGALCVCYSGDCRASLVSGGRSANRGECAQICRMPYDLVDAAGNTLVAGRHLLSLRDLNRLDALEEMADAGVSSFKIEGRLKGVSYVENVVRAYSEALDALCRRRPDDYRRLSAGTVETDFRPDVERAFNRGFTSFFLRETQPAPHSLSSPLTPKFVGTPVGKVVESKGKILVVNVTTALNNGDGIVWFDADGRFDGARINRVDGRRLYLQRELSIPAGTRLFRNYDKAFEDALDKAFFVRVMPIDVTLRAAAGMIVADVVDPQRGLTATASIDFAAEPARASQAETQRSIFARLGDTPYRLREFATEIPGLFIPRSTLADLRRRLLAALDLSAAATLPADFRRRENRAAKLPAEVLTFHDNVANSLARRFYLDHGATSIAPAMEVDMPEADSEVLVMTSRYCLRRELGACLRTGGAAKLPREIYLRPCATSAANIRTMRVDCDCARCRMNLIAIPAKS